MQEGAYDYIVKPLDLEHFREQVNRAAEKAALQKQNQVLQEQLEDKGGFEGIVGIPIALGGGYYPSRIIVDMNPQ